MKWRVVEKLDNTSEVFQYITNTMAPHPTRDFVELRYVAAQPFCTGLTSLHSRDCRIRTMLLSDRILQVLSGFKRTGDVFQGHDNFVKKK